MSKLQGDERASDLASLSLRGTGYIQGQMYRLLEGIWDWFLENRSSCEKTIGVIATGRVEMLEWMRLCIQIISKILSIFDSL